MLTLGRSSLACQSGIFSSKYSVCSTFARVFWYPMQLARIVCPMQLVSNLMAGQIENTHLTILSYFHFSQVYEETCRIYTGSIPYVDRQGHR